MRRVLLTVVVALALFVAGCASEPSDEEPDTDEPAGRDYGDLGLETDGSISSIDQELILAGGPPKDGIPALTDPGFVPIEESDLDPGSAGILVEAEREQRFYPYAILVWHEVVNDHIGDTPIAVTF